MVGVVPQLAAELLRRVRNRCKPPKQSVSLAIQQSAPHSPDHHRLLTVAEPSTTSNSPDLSGMNRRLPLMTGQYVDTCL